MRINAKLRDLSTKAARDLGDATAASRMVKFFAQQKDGVSRIHDKPHTSKGVYGYCSWSGEEFGVTFNEMVNFDTYEVPKRPARGADAEYFNLTTLLVLHELTHLCWRHGAHGTAFSAKMGKLTAFAKRQKALV